MPCSSGNAQAVSRSWHLLVTYSSCNHPQNSTTVNTRTVSLHTGTTSHFRLPRSMGRSVDQDVHAAFIEFRAKDDDKVSLQEICTRHVTPLTSTSSACQCNAFIVIRLERRTQVDKSNTSGNAQAIQTTMRLPFDRKPVPVTLSLVQMAIPPQALLVKMLCLPRRVP